MIEDERSHAQRLRHHMRATTPSWLEKVSATAWTTVDALTQLCPGRCGEDLVLPTWKATLGIDEDDISGL
ncbi:MAG: hypothetical protein KDC98_17205, partial [Planctomycetes bacterium]|nr:hypothetical protein [Planctomycetota bacterium]